jgi:hypothetical protein
MNKQILKLQLLLVPSLLEHGGHLRTGQVPPVIAVGVSAGEPSGDGFENGEIAGPFDWASSALGRDSLVSIMINK